MKKLLLLFLVFPLFASGQDFPKNPKNYVTDVADILTQRQEDILNTKLRAFEDSTSNQLFIYLDNRYAYDLADYSKKIFNAWGIGQKDKNNGILIAIFIADREYRIQVGYGLEAALPSDLTLKIQDENMGPHFKKSDYFLGIDAGVDQLIYYSRNEYVPPSAFELMWTKIGIISLVGLVFFALNIASLNQWNNKPKRKQKYRLLSILFLISPVVFTLALMFVKTMEPYYILIPSLIGSLAQILLNTTAIDKSGARYDNETDDAYERRMAAQRSTSSDNDRSDDSFSGGGGGSSDSGGSSSRW